MKSSKLYTNNFTKSFRINNRFCFMYTFVSRFITMTSNSGSDFEKYINCTHRFIYKNVQKRDFNIHSTFRNSTLIIFAIFFKLHKFSDCWVSIIVITSEWLAVLKVNHKLLKYILMIILAEVELCKDFECPQGLLPCRNRTCRVRLYEKYPLLFYS